MTFVRLQYIIAVDTTVILLQRPNIVLTQPISMLIHKAEEEIGCQNI